MDQFGFGCSSFPRQQQMLGPGVEDLFSTFKNDSNLELDFAADFLNPGAHAPAPRLDAWPNISNAVPMPALPLNYPGGSTLMSQNLPNASTLDPCWKGLDFQFEPPARPYNSLTSASSHLASSPYPASRVSNCSQEAPLSGNMLGGESIGAVPDALLTQDVPSDFKTSIELDMKPFPKVEPSKLARSSARSEKIERERDKAEKLKEKNKRAQRKFRQRQKDRQESAERHAQELSEELKAMAREKEFVQLRNQQLECQLLAMQSNQKPLQEFDEEPVFVPAEGWNSYDPQRGMVLKAMTSMKLTHRQMMCLSLRDLAKIFRLAAHRLTETLREIDANPNDERAHSKLEALMLEHHAVLSYFAINKQQALYQIICTRWSDPPEEHARLEPLEFWEEIMADIELTSEQLTNIVDARRVYIRKLDQALVEREQLKTKLNSLTNAFEPDQVGIVPANHLEWLHVMDLLNKNLDLCHRCHAYFLSRIIFGDCLSNVQAARIIARAFPVSPNVIFIVKSIARRLGMPTHLDTMMEERLKIGEGPTAIDDFVQTFPSSKRESDPFNKALTPDGLDGQESNTSQHELYKAITPLDSTSSRDTSSRELPVCK